MADKVKIGVLGAGAMAKKHIASLRAVGGVKIAGVSGARPESLEALKNEFGVKVFPDENDLLKITDAVDVCLPTFLHEEAVARAAAAGKNVICEKPIALTVAAPGKMIDACEEAGVILMIAHCLRFWLEYEYLKKAVDGGEYGALLSLNSWRFGGFPTWASRGWLFDTEKSGGPAIDLQIHDADMAMFLFGMPAAVRSSEINTEFIRSASAELVYGNNGPKVKMDAAWYLKDGYSFRQGYRAVFETGIVEFDSARIPSLTIFRNEKRPRSPGLPPVDPYAKELEYFAGCIRDKMQPS